MSEQAARIVILTGAGISAESGLGTFRDENGLWTRYNLEEVATPEGFAANPGLVQDFYNLRRANCRAAKPNAAHAALETALGANLLIVTQNVDDLHERAGNRHVLHMHGQLDRALCAACDHRWEAPETMRITDACPACSAPATRPDVVWFGEMPYQMDRIAGALRRADLFVAIGTSGNVYPAAGFVREAAMSGSDTLEINLEPSEDYNAFERRLYGKATEVVPKWVAEILA